MEFLSVPLKTGSYFAVLHIHIIYEHSQTRTTISLSSENAFVASKMSEVEISGRSNRTQSCQQFAIAATFLQKGLCCPGAMTQRGVPSTRYTL